MKTLFEATTNAKSKPITDIVKTFEDACRVEGINILQFDLIGLDQDKESVENYIKAIIITRALNQGWTPDWSNTDQYKYFPWFKHKSSFGLAYFVFVLWYSYANVGSRLCFKSAELAEYAGTQFADIYNNFLTIKQN